MLSTDVIADVGLYKLGFVFLQMIFSSLLGGIFAGLGLHCTNFDSVTSRFNEELNNKSYVLVDEGLFMGNKVSIDI